MARYFHKVHLKYSDRIPLDQWTPLSHQIKWFLDHPVSDFYGESTSIDDVLFAFSDNFTAAQCYEALAILNEAYGIYVCPVCFSCISHLTTHVGDCDWNVGDEGVIILEFFPDLRPVKPLIPVPDIDPNLRPIMGKLNPQVTPPATRARMAATK